jgi:hypothetical protein
MAANATYTVGSPTLVRPRIVTDHGVAQHAVVGHRTRTHMLLMQRAKVDEARVTLDTGFAAVVVVRVGADPLWPDDKRHQGQGISREEGCLIPHDFLLRKPYLTYGMPGGKHSADVSLGNYTSGMPYHSALEVLDGHA